MLFNRALFGKKPAVFKSDRSNPYARDLVGFWNPEFVYENDSNQVIPDLTGRGNHLISASGATLAANADQPGTPYKFPLSNFDWSTSFNSSGALPPQQYNAKTLKLDADSFVRFEAQHNLDLDLISTQNPISVGFWVCIDSWTDNSEKELVGKYNLTGVEYSGWRVFTTSSSLNFGIYDSFILTNGYAIGNIAISPRRWHFVVCTYGGSPSTNPSIAYSKLKIYVDGDNQLLTDGSTSNAFQGGYVSTGVMTVGRGVGGPSPGVRMGLLLVYKRELSEYEVKQLYDDVYFRKFSKQLVKQQTDDTPTSHAFNAGIPLCIENRIAAVNNIPLVIPVTSTVGDYRRFDLVKVPRQLRNWQRKYAPANTQTYPVPSRTLLGLWQFGEFGSVIRDRSRLGHDLTESIPHPPEFSSKFGNQIEGQNRFNSRVRNSIDNCQYGTASDRFNFKIDSKFTVGVWMRPTEITSACIFSNYSGTSPVAGVLCTLEDTNTLKVWMFQDNSNYWEVQYTAPQVNLYTLLTVRFNGNASTNAHQNIDVFYNGVKQTPLSRTKNGSPTQIADGNGWYYGRYNLAFIPYIMFRGQLANSFVLNNAISDNEAVRHFYDPYLNTFFAAVLPTYYPFDTQNDGSTVRLSITGATASVTNTIPLTLKTNTSLSTNQVSIIHNRQILKWSKRAAPKQLKTTRNAQGLLGVWIFDSVAGYKSFDLSNNGNDALASIEDNLVWSNAREYNAKVVDNQMATKYVIPDNRLNFKAGSAYTIEMLVRVTDFDTRRYFGTNDNLISGQGYVFYSTATEFNLVMFTDLFNVRFIQWPLCQANKYVSIALTSDGAGDYVLYFDGIKQTQLANTTYGSPTEVSDGDLFFSFGKGANSFSYDAWEGQLAHAFIYNRKLSSEEVSRASDDKNLNFLFRTSYNLPISYNTPINIPLFVKAAEPTNSVIPLYVSVNYGLASGLSMAVSGTNVVPGSIPLYMKSTVNASPTLFLKSDSSPYNKAAPLYITAPIPSTKTGSTLLYTTGYSPFSSGSINFTKVGPPLSISGTVANVHTGMNLFLNTQLVGPKSSAMNLVIVSRPTPANQGLTLAVGNKFVAASPILYTRGRDPAQNPVPPGHTPTFGVEFSSWMNLYINRNFANTMPLVINSWVSASSGVPLSVNANLSSNSSVNMSIGNTKAVQFNSEKLYVNGW